MIWILMVLLVILGGCFGFYLFIFSNFHKKTKKYDILKKPEYKEYTPQRIAAIERCRTIPPETVHVLSYDGKALYGRLYVQNENAPWHIIHHGYRGNGVHVMAPHFLHIWDRGENVLLVDLRSNGRSEGHTITFGIRERRDTLVWANYLIDRFGKNIDLFLDGLSMGAATVLMTCDLELPKQVRGIIADCPYSSPMAIIGSEIRKAIHVEKPMLPVVFISALLFGRFYILESSPIQAVQKTPVPILLLHGTQDAFVPFSMSEDIQKANPKMVRLVPIEGAPHVMALLKDPDTYTRAVAEFIAACTAETE